MQGMGAFCHTMTFDWRGEHVVTGDDNLTTGSGGQQSCVVRLWSAVKTTEGALQQLHVQVRAVMLGVGLFVGVGV